MFELTMHFRCYRRRADVVYWIRANLPSRQFQFHPISTLHLLYTYLIPIRIPRIIYKNRNHNKIEAPYDPKIRRLPRQRVRKNRDSTTKPVCEVGQIKGLNERYPWRYPHPVSPTCLSASFSSFLSSYPPFHRRLTVCTVHHGIIFTVIYPPRYRACGFILFARSSTAENDQVAIICFMIAIFLVLLFSNTKHMLLSDYSSRRRIKVKSKWKGISFLNFSFVPSLGVKSISLY